MIVGTGRFATQQDKSNLFHDPKESPYLENFVDEQVRSFLPRASDHV